MPPQSDELEAQKSLLVNFDKNWTSLQGAIRSMSSIEPHLVDCNQDEKTIEAGVIEYLEGRYVSDICYSQNNASKVLPFT